MFITMFGSTAIITSMLKLTNYISCNESANMWTLNDLLQM